MVETQRSGSAAWRVTRIVALSLLSLFLLGIAVGATIAHLQDDGGSRLAWALIVGTVLLGAAVLAWRIRRDVKTHVAEEFTVGNDAGEGERLHADQRKRFWAMLVWLAVIGAVIGFGSSILLLQDGEPTAASTAVAAVLAAAFVALTAYGSWRFMQNVDELELADNLWGSMLGFYTYALLFPVWWLFSELEALPEPNQWVIYAASMIVGLGTYFYRKLHLR